MGIIILTIWAAADTIGSRLLPKKVALLFRWLRKERKGQGRQTPANISGPGRTRTCNQTVMSGGIKVASVDFSALSVESGRVHFGSCQSFPV
jgi:hypothetical protein